MLLISKLNKYMMSVLIIFGALIACSPVQTPVAIATATVIASTATNTPTPTTPTAIPPPSSTPIVFTTQTSNSVSSILASTVEIDVDFTREIMTSLADELAVSVSRVQLVSVENAEWDESTLGCAPSNSTTYDRVSISNTVEGLRYVLLVGNSLHEYHTEAKERYQRCEGQDIVSGEILLAVDPLASEIFLVVQNLLATELDLSSRRVQLVDMIPVTWSDTSLGCPQEDQSYTETEIAGYHIVVTAGNETYIYHSDSNTAYPCPLEQSIIPVNTEG